MYGRSICREYHRQWFSNRLRFEQEFWVGAPQQRRNGTLHTDRCVPSLDVVRKLALTVGYELMIPDNNSLLSDETDSIDEQCLNVSDQSNKL